MIIIWIYISIVFALFIYDNINAMKREKEFIKTLED